jgi:hypothetical protein
MTESTERLPSAVEPQPFAGMGAHEAIEGPRCRAGGVKHPGPRADRAARASPPSRPSRASRRRVKNFEHLKHLAAPLATGGSDDQGHAGRGGQRGRSPIGRGDAPEKLHRRGVTRRERDLVDHHGDHASPAQHGACAREGAVGVGELHAEPRARGLPEGIEPPNVEVLGHHQQLDVLRDRARSEVPVPRMGGGHDDPPPLPHHVAPERARRLVEVDRAPDRGAPGHGHPEKLHRRGPQRRIHRPRLPRRPVDTRGAHRLLDVRAPDAKDAPRQPSEQRAEDAEAHARRLPRDQPKPARRTTLPAEDSPSRAMAYTSTRARAKSSRLGLRA